MTKRGMYTAAGVSLGVVAFVGFMALFEHLARLVVPRLKGDDWLRNILPFELATSPISLSVVAIGALVCAWLLLRAAKTS